MAYVVYMHTNRINGKKYIGITSQKYVTGRWHNGEGYKQQRRFYSAIKHYGWDGFIHEVLFSNLSKDEAERKEVELISKYRANDPEHGYNIENGGHTNKYTEEQRKQMSLSHIGIKHTRETREKMSASHIGLSAKWLTGRKASEETRSKMSALRQGENNPRARAVIQLDLHGEYANRFETLNDAARAINVNNTSHISQCCAGKRNKAYGFKWAYAGGSE